MQYAALRYGYSEKISGKRQEDQAKKIKFPGLDFWRVSIAEIPIPVKFHDLAKSKSAGNDRGKGYIDRDLQRQ